MRPFLFSRYRHAHYRCTTRNNPSSRTTENRRLAAEAVKLVQMTGLLIVRLKHDETFVNSSDDLDSHEGQSQNLDSNTICSKGTAKSHPSRVRVTSFVTQKEAWCCKQRLLHQVFELFKCCYQCLINLCIHVSKGVEISICPWPSVICSTAEQLAIIPTILETKNIA